MKLILFFFTLFSPLSAQYYSGDGDFTQLEGTDPYIQRAVQEAFSQNQLLRSDSIQASVDNGVVTLTGTVKSNSEKSIAERVALGVNGVTFVNNQLVISNSF